MKIITSHQALIVSGGCQKAVDKYEASAELYQFVGSLSGMIIGWNLANNMALQVVSALAGHYIGSEIGYAFGAASYWVDRAVHKTTDSLLKPAL